MAVVNAQEMEEAAQQSKGFHQVLKERFTERGSMYMAPVLPRLITGLVVAIERTIYLNMTTTNSKKLTTDIKSALSSKGIEAVKGVCRDTKGPVASIFYQGPDRSSEGIDMAERSVVSHGGVQIGQLEKDMSWISLSITIAPMLGFVGTVISMIGVFDKTSTAGGLDTSLIAGDIRVALLTTVSDLIVAMILQVFYSYIIVKIDVIVDDMRDASISLVGLLVARKIR